MIFQVLHCPHCHGTDIVRHGQTRQGKQRYRCREQRCAGRTFLLGAGYASFCLVGYALLDAILPLDRHILLVDTDECRLYELYDAHRDGGRWTAGSGATWNLRSNALRPAGWTSADAAGLPILGGLVREGEVAAGAIRHAIRFTAPSTCDGYIYPARHEAGSGSCTSKPPMGLRVRLKANVDISGFGPQARVILTALKTYGMILADNGSPWYVSGMSDPRFDDDVLHELDRYTGADLEAVDTAGFVNGQ